MINDKDLKVELIRPPCFTGGLNVPVDASVRITHKPTGLVAESSSERSRLQNKAKAMRELKELIMDMTRLEQETIRRPENMDSYDDGKDMYGNLREESKMRNPDRIPEVMRRLEVLWHKYPDMRLAQLIGNVYRHDGFDPYHMEDEEFISGLEEGYRR